MISWEVRRIAGGRECTQVKQVRGGGGGKKKGGGRGTAGEGKGRGWGGWVGGWRRGGAREDRAALRASGGGNTMVRSGGGACGGGAARACQLLLSLESRDRYPSRLNLPGAASPHPPRSPAPGPVPTDPEVRIICCLWSAQKWLAKGLGDGRAERSAVATLNFICMIN